MKKMLSFTLSILTLMLSHSAFALSAGGNPAQAGMERPLSPVIEDYYAHGLKQITVKTKAADKSKIKSAFSEFFDTSAIQVDIGDIGVTVSAQNTQIPFLVDSYVPTDLAFSWKGNDTLTRAIQDTAAVLKQIGVPYLDTPVHACFYSLEGISYTRPISPNELSASGNTYISVCLSPEFLGIPLAQEPISDRGAYDGTSAAITDVSTIDFTFDSSGSFIAASFPLLEMESEQELSQESVSCQDIFSRTHDQMMALIQDTETNPVYQSSLLQRWGASSLDELLQKYEFRVTRIRSVWLDDYQGHLRPGWYARIEVFSKETNTALLFVNGAYSYPEIFCFGFDAIDGKPNQA